MKKTQVTELFANIRATFVSFISIVMFVALGIAIFLGLRWGSAALTTKIDEKLQAQKTPDIEISYPYGLTDGDIAAVSAIDGVEAAEGTYVSFAETDTISGKNTLRVQQLVNRMGTPEVTEGRLPEAGNELAVLDYWAARNQVSVGDVLELSEPTGIPYLKGTTFTVVGKVTSGDFLARDTATYGVSTTGSGSVDGVAFATGEAFEPLYFLGGYPCVYVAVDGSENYSCFDAAYQAKTKEVLERIAEISGERAQDRFGAITKLIEVAVALGHEALDHYPEIFEEFDIDEARVDDLVSRGDALLGTLADMGWIALDRSENGGLMLADTFQQVLGRLCWSMASLFVVVGLLVCYSAVSRIVYDEVVQVGTKKALGLYRGEIYVNYLAYAGLAVVCGTVIGAVVAIGVVERILNPSLASAFVIGTIAPYSSLVETLVAGGAELALILLAAWFSCRSVLTRRAVELLTGNQSHNVKHRFFEGWGTWNRLPLLAQTMVNNCLNDKRRMVATLVGVAGITSLVVSAMTLQNDVLDSFKMQYTTEFQFDSIVWPKTFTGAAREALTSVGSASTPVLRRAATVSQGPGELAIGFLIVPADESSFFDLYEMHPTSGNEVDLSQDGVWISEGYADKSGAKVGDDVWIRGPGGVEAKTTILGFYTYYLLSVEMVMGAETYTNLYGASSMPNVLLADSGGREASEFLALVNGTGAIATVTNYKARTQRAFKAFQKIAQTVVMLYMGLAALMAVVVLLNLNMMFIQEKRKELTVLMVLGFSTRDAKAYVRNDSIALTFIGIIFGLIVGSVVGVITVMCVEPANTVFIRMPNLIACLTGIVVSAVLSIFVGYIALRQVPRFNLTDVNRF